MAHLKEQASHATLPAPVSATAEGGHNLLWVSTNSLGWEWDFIKNYIILVWRYQIDCIRCLPNQNAENEHCAAQFKRFVQWEL